MPFKDVLQSKDKLSRCVHDMMLNGTPREQAMKICKGAMKGGKAPKPRKAK